MQKLLTVSVLREPSVCLPDLSRGNRAASVTAGTTNCRGQDWLGSVPALVFVVGGGQDPLCCHPQSSSGASVGKGLGLPGVVQKCLLLRRIRSSGGQRVHSWAVLHCTARHERWFSRSTRRRKHPSEGGRAGEMLWTSRGLGISVTWKRAPCWRNSEWEEESMKMHLGMFATCKILLSTQPRGVRLVLWFPVTGERESLSPATCPPPLAPSFLSFRNAPEHW